MNFNKLYLALILCSFISCSGENDESAEQVYVYDKRMLVGCQYPGNISLQESSESLSSLGIDVLSSSCAVLTNISLTESCIDLSGEFYIHGVRSSNLSDMADSNYANIDSLDEHDFLDRYVIGEGGVGYDLVTCSE